jgi:hypothetical protein
MLTTLALVAALVALVLLGAIVQIMLRTRAIVRYHALSLEDWERYMHRHFLPNTHYGLRIFRPGPVKWIVLRLVLPRLGGPW